MLGSTHGTFTTGPRARERHRGRDDCSGGGETDVSGRPLSIAAPDPQWLAGRRRRLRGGAAGPARARCRDRLAVRRADRRGGRRCRSWAYGSPTGSPSVRRARSATSWRTSRSGPTSGWSPAPGRGPRGRGLLLASTARRRGVPSSSSPRPVTAPIPSWRPRCGSRAPWWSTRPTGSSTPRPCSPASRPAGPAGATASPCRRRGPGGTSPDWRRPPGCTPSSRTSTRRWPIPPSRWSSARSCRPTRPRPTSSPATSPPPPSAPASRCAWSGARPRAPSGLPRHAARLVARGHLPHVRELRRGRRGLPGPPALHHPVPLPLRRGPAHAVALPRKARLLLESAAPARLGGQRARRQADPADVRGARAARAVGDERRGAVRAAGQVGYPVVLKASAPASPGGRSAVCCGWG